MTRCTTDDGRLTMPQVWHKLPKGELKRVKIGPLPFSRRNFLITDIHYY